MDCKYYSAKDCLIVLSLILLWTPLHFDVSLLGFGVLLWRHVSNCCTLLLHKLFPTAAATYITGVKRMGYFS